MLCSKCDAPLKRTRPEGSGRLPRLFAPFLGRFRCTRCGRGSWRLQAPESRKLLVRLAWVVGLGLILLQLIWYVRRRAPEHPGGGYEPHDLERQHYLERHP